MENNISADKSATKGKEQRGYGTVKFSNITFNFN